MSGVAKKLMGTTAAGGGFTAIEDVFSTYLYTGNGSTQTITNGIDLAGEGGLVWLKRRDNPGFAVDHVLMDSERGVSKILYSNSTSLESSTTWGTSFNSDGFNFTTASGLVNGSGGTYASWTFRKAPRFFDVVTYTGDFVVGRDIPHNLGTVPAVIIVKNYDGGGSRRWRVYHRSLGATKHLILDTTDAATTETDIWNDTEPTSTHFTVGDSANINGSGTEYVAYLFAHDPLGPSEDGSDGLIACGSFTTDGSAQFSVDLGWEPQWVLMKPSAISFPWQLVDTMRGFGVSSDAATLSPNNANAESNSTNLIQPTANGFKSTATADSINPSQTYIYIAIRRGPMRAPESGTEVFAIDNGGGGGFASGFPVDSAWTKNKDSAVEWKWFDRLRGHANILSSNLTNAESGASSGESFASNTEFDYGLGADNIGYIFRRAPNFFDVVAYTTPTQTDTTVYHNLGVTPELAVVKRRNSTGSWFVTIPNDGTLILNDTAAKSSTLRFTDATATQFTAATGGSFSHAETGATWIAYLFATLAGVSKVGSYTGNQTNEHQIDCGFTTGARFVLAKKVSGTGDWFLFDSARGITTAYDPFLFLNNTDAEAAVDNIIRPFSGGFALGDGSQLNENGSTYIFYAIA